jgi:hypothetical protein
MTTAMRGGAFEGNLCMGTAMTASPNSGAAVALVHHLGVEYVLHLLRKLPWGAIALPSTSIGTASRKTRAGATRTRGRDTLANDSR